MEKTNKGSVKIKIKPGIIRFCQSHIRLFNSA